MRGADIMIIQKEIVPTWALRSIRSQLLINYSYNTYDSIDDFIKIHSHDEIIKTLFNRECSYKVLIAKFNEACSSMKDNDCFVVSYKVNNNFNIKISEQIQIFYYDDRVDLESIKIFPWDYPQNITCFGERFSFSDEEIISDFFKLNILSYYIKYCLGCPDCAYNKPNIKKTNNSFVINDSLKITLDSHIVFTYDNIDIYIADTWWFSNDEIINDLLSLPPAEFGLKYKSFWC